MPVRASTVACTWSTSVSRSAAVAGPVFTMKLACFGDTCAPPMVKPFRPHASMSRAAWSPSGLRKTLPALGWLSGWVATRRARSSRMRAMAAALSPAGNASRADTNHSSASERKRTWR